MPLQLKIIWHKKYIRYHHQTKSVKFTDICLQHKKNQSPTIRHWKNGYYSQIIEPNYHINNGKIAVDVRSFDGRQDGVHNGILFIEISKYTCEAGRILFGTF